MTTELDLVLMKAHRNAVGPLLMWDPHSVMYQIVVTDMGMLIDEVERLRDLLAERRGE